MKIIETNYNEFGPVQIQDHGSAYVVLYPASEAENKGFNREETFSKSIGNKALNQARKFAAEKLKDD
ncbi:MAG: hypothetical protein ACKVH1_11635 [Alphaproteobacteria bacterium]|jgi:hypothetical protein|tara:strand:- start:4468 stop:4668 length:201 start_codon:yes stop_codon:yes gene_type:complete